MAIFKVALAAMAGFYASANASSCDMPSKGSCNGTWMTQWIDHSDHSRGTFQQQIQVFTEHFKPGGPIMFFQGEESTVMTCVETTIMLDYARQMGGIAATIEHRYFGLSAPFGSKKSYTSKGLQYLTLDNVMDDAVAFIKGIQANVTGASNSPAIVASGSYGGYLATAFRLNRPKSFFGAIAAAPPVDVFITADGVVPGRFNWWNWISNVVADKSATAASAVKNAFEALDERLTSGNTADLKDKLDLCTVPKGPLDAAYLSNLMMFPYNLAAEFQYPFANPGRTPIANPLDKLIEVVLANQDDPFELLRAGALLWYKSVNTSLTCLDLKTTELKAVPLIQSRPFDYIVCSYLPIINTGVSKDSLFIAADPAMDGIRQSCNATYGIVPMNADELAKKYHMSQAHYEKSEKIIFSIGQYDPTSSLSPLQLPSTANRNASKVLYVSNMGHREDLFAPDPHDKPEVIRAREIEVETIKSWLGYI